MPPAAPDLTTAPRPSRRADATTRVIGIVLGGGFGALFLVALTTVRTIDLRWWLGLPGLGVIAGCGMGALRRSMAWGLSSGAAGITWAILFAWLADPFKWTPWDVARMLGRQPYGYVSAAVLLALGPLLGAGWPRRPPSGEWQDREPDEPG